MSQAEKLRYSRKEAAEYLGVEKTTLDSWACIKTVNLPYTKIGKKAVYDKVDLDAFRTKHRIDIAA